MRHPNDGTLRTYLDGALPVRAGERLQAHVRSCDRCRARLAQLESRAARIQTLVQPMVAPSDTGAAMPAASVQVARGRLEAYMQSKEEVVKPMFDLKQLFTRRYRPAWVALVMVAVLGLSMTLAPVRAFAGNLLSLFRVQRIEVVEFDPSALFTEEGAEAAMRSLERMMDEQVTVDVQGEPQEVDEVTLRSLSSIRVRLPQSVQGEASYKLQPGGSVSVKVDLPRIRALLTELGYQDVDLPDSLDGADIEAQLSSTIVAAYGDCGTNAGTEEFPGEGFEGNCTVLTQMRSPVVSTPDGLDVQQLGQAYLQLLGMSADEAARFSSRIDWTTTLVVPLPRSEARYEDVTVDGVPGVLIRPTERRLPQPEYLLMWVKEDVVYTLMGSGSLTEAVQVADSLQ